MIWLNIAMAVFFCLLGMLVMYAVKEEEIGKVYTEYLDSLCKDVTRHNWLHKRISELESELKKEREEHYLTKEN